MHPDQGPTGEKRWMGSRVARQMFALIFCAFAFCEGCIRYSNLPSFFNFPMKFPSSPHGYCLASLPMKSSRSWKKTSQSPRATSQNVVRSFWWNLFKIWTRNALEFQIAYLFAMEQPDFQWLAECYKQQVPAGLGTGMCLLHQWMGGGDKADVFFCSWFAFPKTSL